MATGRVIYWNGRTGWIKQNGVENSPTVESSDVMLVIDYVDSGVVLLGSQVTFELDKAMWVARHVTVDERGEPDKPPPVNPPPEVTPYVGDSP